MGETFIGAIGGHFMADIVVSTIRKILNNSISRVKPGQLLSAIRDDVSIWECAGADIDVIASKIPKGLIESGRPMYRKAIQDYGTATELVLAWLKEDNPNLFSLILNTEGGLAWFDRQVRELSEKLGLDYQ